MSALIPWLHARQLITTEQQELVQKWCESRNIDEEAAILECGIFNEDDLGAIYSEIYQVRPIKLEEIDIDSEAVRHVPSSMAREHMLIPIRRTANTLAVVMADPLNSAALAALRTATDFEIIPFLGRADAIEHAIFLHYGPANSQTKSAAHQGSLSPTMRAQVLSNDDRLSHMSKSLPLRREWTWSSLYKTTENQYAVTALQEAASADPDDARTCILIHGGPGLGKTHLLHAKANEHVSRQPLSRVLLTTGTRFADFLFESVRDRKLNLFRYLYRELDLLLIDHADSFLRQDWAQPELLATIQALRSKRKCVCLCSENNLVTSPRLQADLRKELESGTIAEVRPCTEESCVEILRRRSTGSGIAIDVLKHLSRSASGNMSDQLEMVKALVVLAEREGESLTPDSAAQLLQHMTTESTAEVTPLGTVGIPQL